MEASSEIDVAIVGLGPVGAALANLLGQAGVSTQVFERESDIYPLPRAVHFDDEIMRVFQTIGIADTLREKVRVNPGMHFVDKNHKLLLDWSRPDRVSAQGWHPSYRFHQPDLEHLLRESLKSLTTVDVRLNTEVLRVEQNTHSCVVRYRDLNPQNNQERIITARYVVGCDGANSIVRQSINSQYIDFGFKERWLVVDTLLTSEKPELGDYTIQYCDPSRPQTYVRCPENRRRWEITIHDDEDTDSMLDEDNVWQLLSSFIGSDEAKIERKAVYTFQSAIADTWCQGRILLAGDAAHLTPPFMGQGLCGGIRDVSNLGWKLISCLRLEHSDELLTSYQRERAPHMETYIKTAITLGGLINTCGTEQALHSALLNSDGTSKMKSLDRPLGQGLAAGNQTQCGALFPQPLTAAGERLDDTVGYSPVLIVSPEFATELATLKPAWPDLEIVLTTDLQKIQAWFTDLRVKAVLIRPDRYVLGTAVSIDELNDLLAFHPTI